MLCLGPVPLRAEDLAITAIFSSSPASPGGAAQIALTLPSPVAMVTGSLAIDLDPAVFGIISAINVFSASGDQVGLASLQGRHADVQFTSDSGGVGRLPDFPVLQVTVPVLTSTNAGSAVHAQAKGPWRDLAGNTYAMSFQTSGITAGSGPSIQSIVPGDRKSVV